MDFSTFSAKMSSKAKLFCAFCVLISGALARNIKADLPKKEWWQSTVFYQIYPRSFKDSASDVNGTGDIKGIIEKLDYLKDTGITATWLSPILKSPQADHGYDISDFKTVDPLFGTNEDLEELFEKAKEMGIKIIMDFVPNHTSDEHEWFIKSEYNDPDYKDYYVWNSGKTNSTGGQPLVPNNWVILEFYLK